MPHLRAEDIGWDLPIRFRRGGPSRLAGIELYYDFNWYDQFADGRAQFRNGRCLALLVQQGCPDGLIPALLLTARDSVEEQILQTATHFVNVLNLPRYRAQATANAAESYYADRLGIRTLAARPDVVNAVMTQLTIDDVTTWAEGDAGRIQQLRDVPGVRSSSAPLAIREEVMAALATLGQLHRDDVAAIAALLGPDADREARLELVRRITDDPTGRYVTGEVLVQRTSDRVSDARNAMSDYQRLLDDVDSDETTMQHFIEGNLWLLGLDYANMRPRHLLPRGTMDFILQRFDGFHDLLELKSPHDPIVRAPVTVDGDAPPPPSAFSLSPDLAQALAQAHVYRDILTRGEAVADDLYGLPHARDARLIIVIGKAQSMPDYSARVLRELNKSLHHVEIIPYDILAKRANAILDNVSLYLLAAADETS
jgi:hypothetical protein